MPNKLPVAPIPLWSLAGARRVKDDAAAAPRHAGGRIMSCERKESDVLTRLLGIDLPLVQAPMAGVQGSALALAVSNAGGLGSLPCAMLDGDALRRELAAIRAQTDRPFNVKPENLN